MLFVDPAKALDTVNFEALWKVLKRLGNPDKILNVIISYHEMMKAAVESDRNFLIPLMLQMSRSKVVPWLLFSLLYSFQ